MSIYFDFETISEITGNNDYYRQMKQSNFKFKPDDWIKYIEPLVNYALQTNPENGTTPRQSYQRIILLGVLVGLGRTPREAVLQVQEWQNAGAFKSLPETSTVPGGTAGTGTTGTGMGTGGAGTTGGIGTTGTGMGTGGTGTTGGIGTTGTGGLGTGLGNTEENTSTGIRYIPYFY